MKKSLVTILLAFASVSLYSQDITGDWHGVLNVQGIQLRLIFHIDKDENGLSATLDSPDQNANGIPVTLTKFKNSTLLLQMAQLGAEYKGALNAEGRFTGTFFQAGQSFPLELSREAQEKETFLRPQEPTPPYPYHVEEVKFPSEGGEIDLAGTLTLPKKEGKFPAVILISGSGPQNRDEEFMTHKPFLVLADYLTRKGIAVLRYDDRGFASSTGNHATATSLDFANDVRAAMAYLQSRKDIDETHIGLIGHSEGGLIAPLVAANSRRVGFMVLLAGPGIPGSEILLQQVKLMGKTAGMSEQAIRDEQAVARETFAIIKSATDLESLKSGLKNYLSDVFSRNPEAVQASGPSREVLIDRQVAVMTTPWYRYFIQHDPAPSLQKVTCPVLAINGEKDVQIAPENLQAIENALRKGGNKNVTVKEFPGLNHLFQECETGAMDEYATIEQTFSPVALREISTWIAKQARE